MPRERKLVVTRCDPKQPEELHQSLGQAHRACPDCEEAEIALRVLQSIRPAHRRHQGHSQ